MSQGHVFHVLIVSTQPKTAPTVPLSQGPGGSWMAFCSGTDWGATCPTCWGAFRESTRMIVQICTMYYMIIYISIILYYNIRYEYMLPTCLLIAWGMSFILSFVVFMNSGRCYLCILDCLLVLQIPVNSGSLSSTTSKNTCDYNWTPRFLSDGASPCIEIFCSLSMLLVGNYLFGVALHWCLHHRVGRQRLHCLLG